MRKPQSASRRAPAPSGNTSTQNVLQFFAIMRARWRAAVLVFLACVALAAVIAIRAPVLYTAAASVVVDDRPDPVAAAGGGGQLLSDYMQTQTDIVTSQRVAERVVKTLGLDEVSGLKDAWLKTTGGRGDFSGWLAGGLQGSITVPPPRDSNVINITARWSDAKGAAQIANAFAQAYIDTNVELKVQPAKQYASWYDERSRALRADVQEKQKVLSDYQDKEGIIATDEHLDIETARLAELSSQLVAVQAQRQDSQSRERQVGTRTDAIPEILQNGFIANMKNELSQAQARAQDLATQVGVNHPSYQRVQAEIAGLQERIESETGRVIASLSATTRVNRRRENAIIEAMDAQKKRVIELKHQRDYAAVLASDVATAQRNLDAVSQGLAQTSLESQTRLANVAILTHATEPTTRSSPKYVLNMAIGVVLGLVLGILTALGLEKLDQRVRRDAELVQMLGVPLLATISSTTVSLQSKPRLGFRSVTKAIGFSGHQGVAQRRLQ